MNSASFTAITGFQLFPMEDRVALTCSENVEEVYKGKNVKAGDVVCLGDSTSFHRKVIQRPQ